MLKKIVLYLGLNNFGLLEFLFAMYLILCGYHMAFSSSVLVIILMCGLAIKRKRDKIKTNIYQPIVIFLIYYMLHDATLLFAVGPFSYYKSYIGNAIILGSIPFIASSMNYQKLLSSINWVAIVAVLGLLYHMYMIVQGHYVTPIQLPFLSMNEERIQTLANMNFMRPTSFFIEPQAYVSFILVPLFLSLYHKKYIWSGVLVLSLLLSTSTTGVITAFLMLFFFFNFQSSNKRFSLVQSLVLMMIIVALYYLFVSSSFFSGGYEKMQNTNFATTERLNLGITVVSSMSLWELIFGAPFFTTVDYCMANGLAHLVDENGMAYVSTIWSMIFRYGIIGLLLYLYIFYYFVKQRKDVLPYVLVYVITLFSNPDTIGGFFAFSSIFIISFMLDGKSHQPKTKIIMRV